VIEEIAVAAGLLSGLLIAFEIGFRIGRNAKGDDGGSGQVGAIQGAVLGLLGLLLAFCFSGAAGRFLERQDLIVQEANAIGTSYLRADLLDDPHRSDLREALRAYAEHRIGVSHRLHQGLDSEHSAQVEQFHADLWRIASAGIDSKPGAMLGVLPPINDVIDLHSTRVAAGCRHLPMLVVALLIGCSLLALAVMGYGAAISGHRRASLTASLTILIGLSLWVTIDLDHPRAGLIQLSDEPLRALQFDRPQ
jgi:hypothetical protein